MIITLSRKEIELDGSGYHLCKRLLQFSKRKDVERAFGVLQAQFSIVRGTTHMWDKATLRQLMTACVIMHIMIVEDERSEASDLLHLKFIIVNKSSVNSYKLITISETGKCTPNFRKILSSTFGSITRTCINIEPSYPCSLVPFIFFNHVSVLYHLFFFNHVLVMYPFNHVPFQSSNSRVPSISSIISAQINRVP